MLTALVILALGILTSFNHLSPIEPAFRKSHSAKERQQRKIFDQLTAAGTRPFKHPQYAVVKRMQFGDPLVMKEGSNFYACGHGGESFFCRTIVSAVSYVPRKLDSALPLPRGGRKCLIDPQSEQRRP